ncbi:MAG: hypothetical protein JO249_09330 [Acidobacteria bacterium]|nr:hypothetical protein [Acidobacteriota bacterium]
MWYLDRLTPNSPVYNVPFLCRLRGKLDVSAFRKSLDALVDRQEVLRSQFLPLAGCPVSFVLHKRPVGLKEVELGFLPDWQQEAEVQRRAKEEAMRPFNLARDPLLRAFLYRLAEQEYRFLFVTHHIIFELGSLAILYRDLSCFYNAFVSAGSAQLPDLTFHASDFARWQRKVLEGEHLEKLNRYWRRQLSGAPTLDLPLDFPRPRIHTHRGIRYFFEMAPELVSQANLFFRHTGTTPYRGLLAAFYIFLHCYSGLTDISVGSPFASRCPGIENTIGFFANTLVLRIDLSGDPNFRDIIKKVDRTVLRAMANSDLSFEKIVEAVQPPRDPSRTPLFQISFRGRTQPYSSLQLSRIAADSPEFLDNGTAKFDLALELEASTGKACFFEYCSDLFKPQTIREMKDNFEALLGALIAEPNLPLTTVREVKRIIRSKAHTGNVGSC